MRKVFECFRTRGQWPAGILSTAVILSMMLYFLACLVQTLEWLGICSLPLKIWSVIIDVFGWLAVVQVVLAIFAVVTPIRYVIFRRWECAIRVWKMSWNTIGFWYIVQLAILFATLFYFVTFCGKKDQYQTEERCRRELQRL